MTDTATAMASDLLEFFAAHQGDEKVLPETVRLDAYPAEIVERVLANETAHPLLTMAHLDRNGYPFITVMGFTLIDGKIHIVSRRNGLKIKRLQADPRCSMTYHNNIPRPALLACITLVGRARIDEDPEKVRYANELLSHKVYRDGDPDVAMRQPMIDSMNEAQRILVVLDEVEAVYLITPMAPNLPPGIPTPPVAWRADWGTTTAPDGAQRIARRTP